jgi:hypothetical protein
MAARTTTRSGTTPRNLSGRGRAIIRTICAAGMLSTIVIGAVVSGIHSVSLTVVVLVHLSVWFAVGYYVVRFAYRRWHARPGR